MVVAPAWKHRKHECHDADGDVGGDGAEVDAGDGGVMVRGLP